jgi:hypothetical protein
VIACGHDMSVEEYVNELELQLDPATVEKFSEWPVDTKLYMYIHHLQLAYMADFKKLLEKQNA